MKPTTLIASLAATTLITGTALFAAPQVGATLGTDIASVTAALIDQGYDVHEIETEDGRIEAEVSDGTGMWEIEIDPETGAILSVEVEYADDDEDHDNDHDDHEDEDSDDD